MLPAFKQYLSTLKLSPVSRKLYSGDIKKFLHWLQIPSAVEGPTLSQVTSPQIFSKYLASLRSSATAPSMLKRTLASLKQFGTFLAHTYNIENPASPDQLPTTNSQLPINQYITHFTNYLTSDHLSPLTIKSYKSDITRYLDWANKQLPRTEIREVLSDKNIKKYLNHLLQSGSIISSTIDRKEQSLTRFQTWYTTVYSPNHVTDNLRVNAYDLQSPLPLRSTTYNLRSIISLAVLLLFAATLGIFAYRQFARDATLTSAYPSTAVTPNRQLSFQGRLENAAGTPITTATNFVFKLFTASSGGTELYNTGTCSITPDTDGVFNTQIGSTCGAAIASSVFTENAGVWLEVTVVAETLTPRQQIATVAYALNAETLQGFPLSSTISAIRNTIVPMNQYGEIIVGEQSPRLTGVSGTFQISAPALSIITATGTNGNIAIAPDGTGQVNLTGNTTSTNFFNVSNAQLTTGSLITGTVANANTGFKLIDLLSGVSPTSKFSVTDAGQTYIAGSVGVGITVPATTSLLDLTSTTKGFLAPRMTTTQRDAISTPATGLMIYNTTDNQYNVFNGTTWGAVGGGGGGAWSDLTVPTANLSLAHAGYTTAFTFDSVTAADAFALSSSSLTTGTVLDLSSTSTAGGASGLSKVLDITRSGTNANASHTAYGLYSAVTNTGTTSTNIGGYFSASGATNNYGLIVENGSVGIGVTAPTQKLEVNGYIVGQRFVDSASSSFYLDAAEAGINLALASGSLTSAIADSATAIGFTFNTTNTLSTQGAKLLSFQNLGTEKMYLDKDGNLYVAGTLLSGNGTSMLLTNKSGGVVANRALVILDSSNNSSFTTTTTPYNKAGFGVVVGVGLGVTNDADGDGACDANDICMVAYGGEVEVTVKNASTAVKGDYLFTSDTAGSAVASAKQYDGLVGAVSNIAGAGSGYVKMIFKVQPQVTAAAAIDKTTKHNEYWLYADQYQAVGEGANTDTNLLQRGLAFDTFTDSTKTDSANTTVSYTPEGRVGLIGGQTLATSTTDNDGQTYLGSNTVNDQYLYDRTRDSSPEVQVELGLDPNWYNGVTLSVATTSAQFSQNSVITQPNPNLSTSYNGSLIKITGTDSTPRTIYITIKSPTTFDWTNYQGDSATGVTITPGTAQTLGDTGVSATFTNARYNTGDVFKVASWFIEAESATRGAKQQFPERSNVIATASSVDIIDADTQKLWMRFSQSASNNMIGRNIITYSSTQGLNGTIFLGSNYASGWGLFNINFNTDSGLVTDLGSGRFIYKGSVSERNSDLGFSLQNSSLKLVNTAVNDVSAAVIPNQPTQNMTVSGWGYANGSANPVEETVNLPYKFNSTPTVITAIAGLKSTTAPSSLADCTANGWGGKVVARSISTSNFIVDIQETTGTPSSGNYYCYTWTATGQVSPRQFVAVATGASGADGGTTIINETDQTAVNVTVGSQNGSILRNSHVVFAGNTLYTMMVQETTLNNILEVYYGIAGLNSSETSYEQYRNRGLSVAGDTPTILGTASSFTTVKSLSATAGTSTIDGKSNTIYIGTDAGLTVLQENQGAGHNLQDGSEEALGSVKYYTKDYISEEMVGDIQGMWPFYNNAASTTVTDVSIKGNTGTAARNTSLISTSGVRGTGYNFNGTSDTITAGTTVLNTPTSGSVGMWVKPTANGATNGGSLWMNTTLLSKGNLYMAVQQLASNKIRAYFYDSGAVARNMDSNAALPLNTWSHIVYTWNSSGSTIYINGVPDTTSSLTWTNVHSSHLNGAFAFGQYASSYYYTGAIDEPFVTATALTPSQIKNMYQVGYRALQSHGTTLGGGAADTNQQLGGTTNTIGAAQPDLNNQFMYVGTNSTTLGAVSKIDLNSDTNIKTYNSSANVPTGGALLIDEDTKSLAVGYNLEAVGSAASGVKTMGVDNNATATSGNFIGKTVTTAESFTQAYLWAQYTLDASDASNTIEVWASNDGGSNYSQCNLTNTDTSRSPSEYEYFCQFNTPGSSLKTKFVMARGSTKTNTWVSKYGIAWIDSNAVAGSANGSGLFTGTNASVANGSYIDVAHNQNSNDVVNSGWVYNTTTSKWENTDIMVPTYATGGTIATSSGYTTHTFTATGTVNFTPNGTGLVDVLVVAGGGGGGGAGGGGGGAGGLLTGTGHAVTNQAYSITVGAGGVGSSGATGTTGEDSIFHTITSSGGGGGGKSGSNGVNGGSGGGGGHTGGGTSGGSGIVGQGNNGGLSPGASAYGTGGGGGASAVGQDGTTTDSGDGGAGTSSSITGTSVTYAGGGGGGGTNYGANIGNGGTGGGGNGGSSGAKNGVAGTANTGGGGGGSYGGGGDATASGGNGGSGIVIVRYATDGLLMPAFKVVQQDANTVRLYNYSGATQNLRLDVITGGLGRNAGTVSLAPAAADVDSQASTNSIWINKTGSGGNLLKLQTSGTDQLTLSSAGQLYVAGAVGVGTASPASTALLDLTSTTQGFLAPRMTTTERNAISTPATGLMIYNTTDNQYNVYNGTSWGAVGGSSSNWRVTAGALSPLNDTLDLLVGNVATSSAKAGFININSGTPTATVSAGVAGGAYLTATGILATTAKQTLTLGNATTGNIVLAPGGVTALTAEGANLTAAGNVTLTSAANLIFGTTTLAETTSAVDSGAYVVGAFDEFTYSNATNVQGVLNDLDIQLAALTLGTSGVWTDAGTYLYATSGEVLGNAASGGANKIAGLYLGDSAPMVFGADNDFTFSFSGSTLGSTLTAGTMLGINTTTALATLDVRSSLGTIPVASISGATAMAALVVDQSGIGDLFTASKSGDTKFVVTNAGNVGIGVSAPTNKLEIGGSTSTISNAAGDITIDAASNNISFAGDSLINILNTYVSGELGIGIADAVSKLHVSGAVTGKALAIFNELGDQDILTASASGATRFRLRNDGSLSLDGDYLNFALTEGSGGYGIRDNAGTLEYKNLSGSWAGIGTGGGGGGSSNWRYNLGTLSPLNDTVDLLVGGNATSSAKFAVLNINSGTPTATVSAGTAGGAYLTATGILATTAKQTLALGDATTTGNIILQGGSVGIGVAAPVEKLEVNGYIVGQRFVDSASSSFYLDAAATGTSLSIEGNIVGNGAFYLSTGADATAVSIGTTGAGKLDAGTIDPPYTINGEKFATYMSSMTGVKEETTGVVQAEVYIPGLGYRATLDFAQALSGSDLWLFSKVSNLQNNLDKMIVLLSATGSGRTWYEINASAGQLYLYSDNPATISYRLTAPRFDATAWLNTRGDESDSIGFVINDENTWSAPESAGLLSPIAYPAGAEHDSRDITITAPVVIRPTLQGSSLSDTPALIVEGEIEASSISARLAILTDIQADTITARNIIADTIEANHIIGLDAKIASLSAGLTDREVDSITDRIKARLALLTGNEPTAQDIPVPAEASASASVTVAQWHSDTASASATMASADIDFATINNYLAVIGQAVITDLDVTGHLYATSINSKTGILTLGDNTLIVDSSGQVMVNGDLTVSGLARLNEVEAAKITVSELNLERLNVYDEAGSIVASIDASGSANLAQLTTQMITIASSSEASTSATPSALASLIGTATSNATAGQNILLSPNTELTIESPYITPNSLVYLTPTGNTDNKVVFVKSKESCTRLDDAVIDSRACTPSFTVAIDAPATNDISFNWWVIRLQNESPREM